MSLSSLLLVGAVWAGAANAQLELPAASPQASVSQRVGLTDISVEYASPAVNGRTIWGGLVPWDKIWRTGANASTKITFSRDVTVGGKPVPAGTYSLVTLPTAKGWTLILNRELQLFSGKSYNQTDDVVRVPATFAAGPHHERLMFSFANTTNTTTTLQLEWEKARVGVLIEAGTAAQAKANIQAAADNAWRPLAQAARYLADTEKDLAGALALADRSIAIQSTWYNQWVRADILGRQGKYTEGLAAAQKAWDLGKDDKGFFFKSAVENALKEWKAKS
jgi:hypothetical protein